MRGLRLVIGIVALGCVAARAADNGPGTLSGTVCLKGAPPAIPLVHPELDFEVCGSGMRAAQSLVLGTNQSVRDVVVYLGNVTCSDRNPTPAARAAVLNQRNCEFVPRIQIARAGAALVIRNSDPVLHVVHVEAAKGTNAPTTLLDVATPYAGYEKRFTLANFREPTLLRATCGNGHVWMSAFIAVMPHPWAALTGDNGEFTLGRLPAGNYRLYAWHEVLGTLARDVQVTTNRATTVELEFTASDRPPVSDASKRPD